MTQVSEPRYDTDPANKAYVDRVNGKTAEVIGTKSRNFGMAPEPPYHINDTYMDGSDIYICIRDKEFGVFDKADWKLAVDYTNDDVANSKNKVFTEQPVPPYNKGDLWTSGPNGELRRCVTSRESGSYVASDWENATSYDSTNTVIENGLVTSGTIQVVNGGTVAAGMTGNGSGDDAVRFWAGSTSGNKNSAPFRVTQKGYLYAENANIKGTITATSGVFDNVTINGNCTINGEAVKTGTIDAERLDSSVITTGNLSAQSINANKITGGSISSAGINIYNGTGFLKMLHTNWAYHPYVSALNVAHGGGGIVLKTGESNTVFGTTVGGLQLDSDGTNYNVLLHSKSGYNLNIQSGSNAAITSSEYVRANKLYIKHTDNNTTLTTANDYQHARVTIYNGGKLNLVSAGGEYVYAGGTVSSAKVMTDAGSASSRNVKENIVEFTDTEYNKALCILNNLKIYDYDYKYDLYDNRHQYGFIIDEIEELDPENKYFKITSAEATVEGEHLDFARTNKDLPTMTVKKYDTHALDKYMLTCIKALQNKIDKLEERIKLLEGGNQYE